MADHRDTMERLARENGWKRGIELGLGSGMLFRRLLGAGVQMIGVDMGVRPDRRRGIEAMARDPELSGSIEFIHWTTTEKAAPLVADGWADFIFIDAGHSYSAARQDIRLWAPKVRAGGWVGGHDYHEGHPGVIRAVNEAFGADGIDLHEGWIWSRKAAQ